MRRRETNAGRLNDRWLQVLLAPAVAWALYSVAIWLLGERLEVPDFVLLLLSLTLGTATAMLVLRFRPGFCRVPSLTGFAKVWLSLLLAVPVVAIAVATLTVAVCLVLEPPPWKSQNPQAFPALFWYAPICATAFTPLAAIVAASWWLHRRQTPVQRP